MDLFRDVAHVALRSRVDARYLWAREDGERVGASLFSAALNAAWAVRIAVRGGVTYVLLRSAAYGRYLGVRPEDQRVVQRVYDAPEQVDFLLWEPVRAADGSGDVVMRNWWHRPRHLEVTVDNDDGRSMRWAVEEIPATPEPPDLPDPVPNPGPVVLLRMIAYVRANDQGIFDPHAWSVFWFSGQSVFRLRAELALRLDAENVLDITLCVRAGSQGQLTPLLVDLPSNEQGMEIVVLATESTAARGLQHPDVEVLLRNALDELFQESPGHNDENWLHFLF